MSDQTLDTTPADLSGQPDETPDWDVWESEHPSETWIRYTNENGESIRVPVWYYLTLGF